MNNEETRIEPHQLTEDEYRRFFSLVQLLVDNGYDVRLTHHREKDGGYFYECLSLSTGLVNTLRFAFCSPNLHTYKNLSGAISCDHIDCFDKWSMCPLKVSIPENEDEERLLLTYMSWLGTLEGYERSVANDFDYYVQNYDQIKALLTKREEG